MKMKIAARGVLILGICFSVQAIAEVQVTPAKKTQWASDSPRFMNNYKAKIAALENYTVTYVEPGARKAQAISQQQTQVQPQPQPPPQMQKSDRGVALKLIKKVQKKS